MKIITSMILIAFEDANIEDKLDDLQQELEPFKKTVQKLKLGPDAPSEIPRFVATSNYGHSTIIVNNQSVQITTAYDGDYGMDFSKVYSYINSKLTDVINIVNRVLKVKTTYTGLSVNIETDISDPAKFISDKFLKLKSNKKAYDNSVKLVYIVDNSLYINFDFATLNSVKKQTQAINKLSNADIIDQKLGIVVDINDRYAFNQNSDFFTDEKSAHKIIKLSENIINKSVMELLEKGELNIWKI